MRVAPLRERNVLCAMHNVIRLFFFFLFSFGRSLCVLFMIISRYYNRITCQHVVKISQMHKHTFIVSRRAKCEKQIEENVFFEIKNKIKLH